MQKSESSRGRTGGAAVIKADRLPYFSLLLAIATTPLNTTIFSFLRLNDLFLLAAFFLSIMLTRVSKSLIYSLFFLNLILLTSVALNLSSVTQDTLGQFAFFYKYNVPLLTALSLISTTKTYDRIRLLSSVLFFTFLLMVAWVYYYKAGFDSGAIVGLARLSFPGSDDFLISDAHLYSNYLSLGLLYYIFFLRKVFCHQVGVVFLIVCLTFLALILTYSRNGLLIFFGATTLYAMSALVYSRFAISAGNIVRIAIGILIFLAILFSWSDILMQYLSDAVDRAFFFDFSNDSSALSRLDKYWLGISEWLGTSLLFGASVTGASLVWYDSGVGIILVHAGLVGLAYVFLGVLFFLIRVIRLYGLAEANVRTTLTILLAYVVSNGITEFVFVTRSALPVVLFILTPLMLEKIKVRARLSKVEVSSYQT